MKQAEVVWRRGERELARTQIWLASSWWSRMRGLLGRPQLLPGEGLKIVPCNSIHCFFMAAPIDVVFLDNRGYVLRVCPEVRPWLGRVVLRAQSVVELASGEARRLGLTEGDRCC